MWQHLTWCGGAWEPKHFFFVGLTVFTIYNATKSTWLGKRKGGTKKNDPFNNWQGMLLHILISGGKKICGGQMVKSLKNL